MDVMYATREQVTDSLEVFESARAGSLVDSRIKSGARSIESLLGGRRFYPELKTVKFDFPNYMFSPTWELWLGQHWLVSLTSLTSGGITIPTGNVKLRRFDNRPEPPYTYLQIDLSSVSSFQSGTTWQEAINVTGVFGHSDTDTSFVDGQLGSTINNSVKSIVLNPSSGEFNVGVGSLLLMETERIIVTNRIMSNTTQTLTSTVDDHNNTVTVPVSSGAAFAIGEVILVDAERMKIVDIAGNNLFVRRAWDGSSPATHANGTAVFALRTFTVARGVLGSTAAGHNSGVTFSAHRYPATVNELNIAEAVVLLEQNSAGYARTVGTGASEREATGAGLEDLRMKACSEFGRVRSGAV